MKTFIMAIAAGSLALTGIACGGGSACQAAADSAGACGEAYMAAMDMEAPATEGGEEAPACVDDASTDAMYDCMAAAYDAGDCTTAEGMAAAAAKAADCASADAGDDAAGDDAAGDDAAGDDAAGDDAAGDDAAGDDA